MAEDKKEMLEDQISDEQLEEVAGGVNLDQLRQENLDKDAVDFDTARQQNLEKD
ncbi:MAG: hypothetical protein ACFCVD_07365 [Nodosilinea sp.]